jgi:hypothetical protein
LRHEYRREDLKTIKSKYKCKTDENAQLLLAAALGHTDDVLYLLSERADKEFSPHRVQWLPEMGTLPLHVAAEYGRVETFAALTNLYRIDAVDAFLYSAACYAALADASDIIKYIRSLKNEPGCVGCWERALFAKSVDHVSFAREIGRHNFIDQIHDDSLCGPCRKKYQPVTPASAGQPSLFSRYEYFPINLERAQEISRDIFNQKIVEASFIENNIGDDVIDVFISMMKKCQHLDTLILNEQKFTDRAVQALAFTINEMRRMEHLSLGSDYITDMSALSLASIIKSNQLSSFALGRNALTEEGFRHIADAIRKNTSLESITLCGMASEINVLIQKVKSHLRVKQMTATPWKHWPAATIITIKFGVR